jgi:hypothetical protein
MTFSSPRGSRGVRLGVAAALLSMTAACGPGGDPAAAGSTASPDVTGRIDVAADRASRAATSAPVSTVAPTTVPDASARQTSGLPSASTTATQAPAGTGSGRGPAGHAQGHSAEGGDGGPAAPSAAAQAPAAAAPAGALTNRIASFTAAEGNTADYRVFAEGIDVSKPVGLLVYADGTGEYGLENPTSAYAIGGSGGLAAVARAHNMVLATPFSPNRSCACWEQGDAAGYADYLAALISQLQAQYGAHQLWFAGYSSGAQAATRFLFPAHPELWSGGGGVIAIGGGGAPAGRPASFPAQAKNDVVLRWNTGALDTGPGFNALSGPYGAQAGQRWYADQGFDTQLVIPAGVGHSRSGEFGRIVEGLLG